MRLFSGLFLKLGLAAVLVGAVVLAVPFGLSDPKGTMLSVPYVPQVFRDEWSAPWDEACEEASTLMVDAFYENSLGPSEREAKRRMQEMVAWENQTFQTYQDTDAEQTVKLIAKHASFRATVQRTPTLEQIKHELASDRPVIALVNMYQLYQEPDLGDSYHVFVITGYDDQTQAFRVNDPARRDQHVYAYARLMGALHDFNPATGEADGTPTVLFTRP